MTTVGDVETTGMLTPERTQSPQAGRPGGIGTAVVLIVGSDIIAGIISPAMADGWLAAPLLGIPAAVAIGGAGR